MKYLIVLWDTKKLFNINSEISEYVGNITKKFFDLSLKFLNEDYHLLQTTNLNDIFKQTKTYDKYIIISYGWIIVDPQKFWSGIANDKNNISAQILNLSTDLYSLHEQILIFEEACGLPAKSPGKSSSQSGSTICSGIPMINA